MSGRYLVMPRGINVGTGNPVPMAELRSKLIGAGHYHACKLHDWDSAHSVHIALTCDHN